jgi:spermidine synthase
MTAPRVELLRDLERETGWVLLVDGVEQSYVDVADPMHLEFEYMQHIGLVLDAARPRPDPVVAVHLGGGAFTLPRWLSATRPGSRHVVVETSAEVLDVIAPLRVGADCEIIVDDAMSAVAALPPAVADLVIWDLYDGPRAVTAALTLDALASLRGLLPAERGLAVLNVSDVLPFDVVRPVLASLRMCFADVALLAEPSTLRGRRSGNCVLVASAGEPLPVEEMARRSAGAPVRGRVVAGDDLDRFVAGAVPATDSAPLPLPDAALGRGFL